MNTFGGWGEGERIGNIRKAFFSEKTSTFLLLEPESFISQNLRNFFQSEAFLFFELVLKNSIFRNIRGFLGFSFHDI